MKKLFFFKSSSSNGNSSTVPPSSKDKEVYWENQSENELNDNASDYCYRSPRGLFSKSRRQISDCQSSSVGSGLRRSRSFSSSAVISDELGQRNFTCSSEYNKSPSSNTSYIQHQQCDHSSLRRSLTPKKNFRAKQCEVAAIEPIHAPETPCSSGSSRTHLHSSGSSSYCSSNVSTKVIDRYIDGEQQQERRRPKSTKKNASGNKNVDSRLPPRFQHTAPTSPRESTRSKPKSRSFREGKSTSLHFLSRDFVETGFGHESPCRLAKSVIERLSQTHSFPKSCSMELDHDVPLTIEDIYGGSLNRVLDSNLDVFTQKNCASDEPHENVGYHRDDFSDFQKQNCFFGGNSAGLKSYETEEDTDEELHRKFKEAEERVLLLSEEHEHERFLHDSGFDTPSMVQTIRHLTEERINLALEVSGLLQSRIAERDFAREELRMARLESDSQIKRLEKEKNELQSGLENELDRRSSNWSIKLEKYQLEEQRLRERVRELAEQNVSLQREVSSFNEKETESRSMITYSQQQLKELTRRVEEVSHENQDLRQNLSELEEKYRAATEGLDCMKRNFEEKDKECKELQKSITRLLRTCSEQERTIEGLREACSEEIGKQSFENKKVVKLQMEQMRLTGVEMALRREVESYRLDIDSLRHENINLLNRLKGNANDIGALTFKLDQEVWTRTCCLQDQGLSMLNESTQLCAKLMEFIKGKTSQIQETQHGLEVFRNGLDGQFIVESDMKVQGFKRAIENLTRSLQTVSTLMREKSSPAASKFKFPWMDPDGSGKLNDKASEEVIRSELKAETLLTSLLREKLYSKELEVEQFQAELATAVRSNDILRCELQNAMDNISCLTHRLKDLEVQMLKKDEKMNLLQNDLQESTKELTIMRGILPKVSEERDLMWEEVKQYSEKNMLLNSEASVLKKKIEALDEDILLKEGQITILKDTLRNKSFDLLATPDSTQDFLLD